MNEVTSRFVPNLCPEQDNKVSGALAPPTKKATGTSLWSKQFEIMCDSSARNQLHGIFL